MTLDFLGFVESAAQGGHLAKLFGQPGELLVERPLLFGLAATQVFRFLLPKLLHAIQCGVDLLLDGTQGFLRGGGERGLLITQEFLLRATQFGENAFVEFLHFLFEDETLLLAEAHISPEEAENKQRQHEGHQSGA